MQDNYSNLISQGGLNLDIPGWYHIANIKNPDNPRDLRNLNFRTKSIATYANIDLDYKEYLYFNATARYESTSKLPKSNRSYFYPSAGISFIPTKAFKALQDSKLSFLKLYANYTSVASTAVIGAYRTQLLGSVAAGYPFPQAGNSYTDLTNLVDPNIKPEYYKTIEAGFNMGFFNDRLTLEGSVYNTKTTDLISDASTSYTSGIINKLSNIGSLENKGFEVDLGFTPVRNENFNWSGKFSYSKYDTKITSLEGGTTSIQLYDVNDSPQSGIVGSIVAAIGESFPALYGSTWERDSQGRVILDATGLPTASATQKYLGKATPDYILNYTNTINYKGFGLSFTLDYRTGHQFFSETKYNLTWNGHLEETADFDRDLGFIFPNSSINTGTPANPVYTNNTSLYTGVGYSPTGVIAYYGRASQNGENNITDATALKVREISLSYSLPLKYTKDMGISSLKFSINARNPFVLLAKSNRGFADPEASNNYDGSNRNVSLRTTAASNTSPNAQGFVETGQYPSTRTLGVAINVSF
jgi:hypothetical protein